MRLWDAQELGLTSRHLAVELGVAEKRGAFALVPDLGRLALREELLLAHVAAPAGDVERDHDPVTGLDVPHLGTHGLDDPHRLVTEDVAFVHERPHDLVEVQVRTADPAGSDSDNRVGRLLDGGIGDVFHADVALSVISDGLHLIPP